MPDRAAEGRKCPAVIMLHDHGARFDIGKEKLVRPMAGAPEHVMNSSRQWVDKYFDGTYFADSLCVTHGCVVLVGDAPYWGSRSSSDAERWSELSFGSETGSKAEVKALKNAVYEGQTLFYDNLLSSGVVWAEKILAEDAAGVELLASMPFVDCGRIGAFGFSMGAHRCWMLAARCPLVRAAASVCWMDSIPDSCERAPKTPSDYSMYIPALRDAADFPEVARDLYPRSMLFLAGRGDALFPAERVARAFCRMHEIYAGANALETEFFDGGHHCGHDVQARVMDFFNRTLR